LRRIRNLQREVLDVEFFDAEDGLLIAHDENAEWSKTGILTMRIKTG
jgi:hypothetical protein